MIVVKFVLIITLFGPVEAGGTMRGVSVTSIAFENSKSCNLAAQAWLDQMRSLPQSKPVIARAICVKAD